MVLVVLEMPYQEYYLNNFRNKPKHGEFKFIQNGSSSLKKKRYPVDIVPHNPYGDKEDHSIPKFLLFAPFVGAWMAALILISRVSPRASTIVSHVCRHISEATRTLSERTAAMHERNKSFKRKGSSSVRRERNQELVASDQSISPCLLDIAKMTSDEEGLDDSGDGTLSFSFRKAKTVIVSNSKGERGKILREPSPHHRSSPSKQKHKHATRQRLSNDRNLTHEINDHKSMRQNHSEKRDHSHSQQKEFKAHKKHNSGNKEMHNASSRIGRMKSKSSHMYGTNMSPLEKKLSNDPKG